jgi:translation initiation factor 2B subunit (eIF-2B alpha/beta/delta family)
MYEHTDQLDYKLSELKTYSAIDSLYDTFLNSDKREVYSNLVDSKLAIENNNYHNTFLKNVLDLLFVGVKKENIFSKFKTNKLKILQQLKNINKNIAEIGSKKIKNGDVIFIPYLSYEIESILLNTKNKNKNFSVYTLEHKPFNSGKKLKQRFSDIKVISYPDTALRAPILNSDICFISAESIHENEFGCKTGSFIVSLTANKHSVPVYVCTSTLKVSNQNQHNSLLSLTLYDLDLRKNKETFYNTPRYESVPFDMIQGVITEIGILPPKHIIKEIQRHHKLLVKSLS